MNFTPYTFLTMMNTPDSSKKIEFSIAAQPPQTPIPFFQESPT
jgi:hypothetical protein